ncbi:MAG: hypothetical protein Q4E55_02850 [Bacteroidales bacterium]|nr:hypothetical protein [Bacteroidales bacterium]
MNVIESLVPIFIVVVLPIMVVWMISRVIINQTNKRTQIVLAAIEKNPNTDVREFLKLLASPRTTSVKQRLLWQLRAGCMFSFLGLSFFMAASCVYAGLTESDQSFGFLIFAGSVALGIGISFLICFFIGKLMLAKELEQEENEASGEK